MEPGTYGSFVCTPEEFGEGLFKATKDWENAIRGKFYRPVKKSVSLRIDADVLNWFKLQGKGYQTRINQTLREAMLRQIAQKNETPSSF